MSGRPEKNRRVVLASRPRGRFDPSDLRLEAADVPAPAEGEVLLRTLALSLDPYMREVMNEVPPAYAPSIPIGAPIVGGTVSEVVASRSSRFRVGDRVLANAGWQDFAVSDGTDLVPLGGLEEPSRALGVLGMPAFTAHVGLLDIGRPAAGETVVVAAAAGAVGAVVGQLAKLAGARAVGIAGGAEKCRYVVEELGFDACLDRHEPDLARRLATACPSGIDVYFESVGGAVLDAVLPLLVVGARVPVCGAIAHYDERIDGVHDRLPGALKTILQKRIEVRGFVILDHYGDRYDVFRRAIGPLVDQGKIKLREDVVDGLENAPAAFRGMLDGKSFGKLVVRVGALAGARA